MVRGHYTDSTHLRLLGYQEALHAAGMRSDPTLVFETDGFGIDGGVASLLAALDAGVRFDALICRDDLFAMAALVATSGNTYQPDEESAKKAFQLADAMLVERERRHEYAAARKTR